jgi:hypothetical protein
MRLPCVRFTLRTMMITVAAVAVILAIRIETVRMRERSLDYQLRSLDHRLGEMMWDGSKPTCCLGPLGLPSATRNPRKAAYHAAMSRKLSDAALRPWLPVEPNPPEPK